MSRPAFSARLAKAGRELGSLLCLGLDPTGCADATELERFCVTMLEAALPQVAAVKPNLAFFEQHGSAGLAVLERVRRLVPDTRLVILDAKRGDIGSTAEAYARALFDIWGADAVTVNPLMGGMRWPPSSRVRGPPRCFWPGPATRAPPTSWRRHSVTGARSTRGSWRPP